MGNGVPTLWISLLLVLLFINLCSEAKLGSDGSEQGSSDEESSVVESDEESDRKKVSLSL